MGCSEKDMMQVSIRVKISISLFEEIIDMSREEEKDFNSMILSLIECGKLCLTESDALEVEHEACLN